MFTDLSDVLFWTLFVSAPTMATIHLGRHLGVLVLSQAMLSASAALLFARVIGGTSNPWLALALALVGSTLLGLLHFPILLCFGRGMTVILTVIAQMVIQEFWLAAPAVTGGSGGILLATRWWAVPTATLALITLLFAWRLVLRPPRPATTFDWPCLRHLGPHAGAFGVAANRHYYTGFALFGLVCGLVGVAATQLVGTLSIQSWGLSWPITLLLIALLAYESPFATTLTLALIYSTLRIVFRQSIIASALTSHLFELAFPLVLMIVYASRLTRFRAAEPPSYPTMPE
jgi:ABC-type branched-subunit amino acid transport system permease subunit